jgi:iron(III) transport system ATP-binding protein
VTGESRARLRQLDTPEAIYRRPVDAHVAELTGEAIFLEGQGLGLQAQTPLGVLPLERAAEGAVELMLRPEQLRFEPQSDGPAAVLKRRFLGARTHLRVETPAGVLPVDCEEGAKVGARGVIKVEGGAWPLPR